MRAARRLSRATVPALLALLCWSSTSLAAARLVITGAGFGHGVGMSQYGAYGFAKHGATYREILGHYYTGTRVDRLPGARSVRVLLTGGHRRVSFTGASEAGDRRLRPSQTYTVSARGAGVELLSGSGRHLATLGAPALVIGAGAKVTVVSRAATGTYRGSLEFRPASGGLNVINAVSLEDYVRGVVARESPSSWPDEALRAQAVAARSYAVTTSKGGAGFDQYADTRSQVYGGVTAETPATDAAVAATEGQVVTYGGMPVVTYFFSTSGGRTETARSASPVAAPSRGYGRSPIRTTSSRPSIAGPRSSFRSRPQNADSAGSFGDPFATSGSPNAVPHLASSRR